MGIKELATKVAEAHGDVSVSKATAILRIAFQTLHQELTATAESSVKCPPLGNFRLADKPAKKLAEGEAAHNVRRVVLHLAKAKPEGKEKPAKDKTAANEKRAARKQAKAGKGKTSAT